MPSARSRTIQGKFAWVMGPATNSVPIKARENQGRLTFEARRGAAARERRAAH